MIVATDGDFPGSLAQQSHYALHRGALPRAIWPKQAYYFASIQMKCDVIDRVLLAVLLDQIRYCEHEKFLLRVSAIYRPAPRNQGINVGGWMGDGKLKVECQEVGSGSRYSENLQMLSFRITLSNVKTDNFSRRLFHQILF